MSEGSRGNNGKARWESKNPEARTDSGSGVEGPTGGSERVRSKGSDCNNLQGQHDLQKVQVESNEGPVRAETNAEPSEDGW